MIHYLTPICPICVSKFGTKNNQTLLIFDSLKLNENLYKSYIDEFF